MSLDTVRPGDLIYPTTRFWACEEPGDARGVRLTNKSYCWYPVVQVKAMESGDWVMIRNANNRCWWIELESVVEARRNFTPIAGFDDNPVTCGTGTMSMAEVLECECNKPKHGFALALIRLCQGRKAARSDWGIDGKWVTLWQNKNCYAKPFFSLRTPDTNREWVPLVEDLLAVDWYVLD